MTEKEVLQKAKKTKGYQLFTIPNTVEGRLCVKMLRKFQNPKMIQYIKVRGRGHNRKERVQANGGVLNFSKDMPVSLADYFAVYVVKKY